jgi:hypothetical protein
MQLPEAQDLLRRLSAFQLGIFTSMLRVDLQS